MRKDWDTLRLCDRFFDAIEQKDFATVESCYAPEAVVCTATIASTRAASPTSRRCVTA